MIEEADEVIVQAELVGWLTAAREGDALGAPAQKPGLHLMAVRRRAMEYQSSVRQENAALIQKTLAEQLPEH